MVTHRDYRNSSRFSNSNICSLREFQTIAHRSRSLLNYSLLYLCMHIYMHYTSQGYQTNEKRWSLKYGNEESATCIPVKVFCIEPGYCIKNRKKNSSTNSTDFVSELSYYTCHLFYVLLFLCFFLMNIWKSVNVVQWPFFFLLFPCDLIYFFWDFSTR